jgi:hypothetical protein
VRAVPLTHPVGGFSSCPAGTGQATVLAFAYHGRPDADLWYDETGCSTIRNGFIMAWRLLHRLDLASRAGVRRAGPADWG